MDPAAKRCMKTVQIVIDNELHDSLVAEAKQRRISLGDYLRATLAVAAKAQSDSEKAVES